MSEILFAAYRDHFRNRVEVNNAMVALLAGSRLAADTLGRQGDSDKVKTMIVRVF